MMTATIGRSFCHRLVRWGLAWLATSLVVSGAVHAQGRSGMGGSLGGGMGAAMRPSFENLPDVAHHASNVADAARSANTFGQEMAEEARSAKLSPERIENARKEASDHPDLYETDRNGALAIRSEILAYRVSPDRLDAIKQAGFDILRETRLSGLDLTMLVLAKRNEPTKQAIRQLRRIDPDGVFDNNHVFFESGSRQRPLEKRPAAVSMRGGHTAGIIDTGVQPKAPSFSHITLIQRSFVGASAIPADHGTAVAAIMLEASRANGEQGAIDKLYAADVYGNKPTGGTAELLAQGLDWMEREQVPVINVSLVGPPNAMIAAVVRAMLLRGHLIIAPVGNDGPHAHPLYPASYPGVIAVSAVDGQDRIMPEASKVPKVDFVARGIATAPDGAGRMTMIRGTSFAAPVVGGRLAASLDHPDSVLARQAVIALSKQAHYPKGASRSRGYGHGIVDGLPPAIKETAH